MDSRYRYSKLTYFCGVSLLFLFIQGSRLWFQRSDAVSEIAILAFLLLIPALSIIYMEYRGSSRGQKTAGAYYLYAAFLSFIQPTLAHMQGAAEISNLVAYLIYARGALSLIAGCLCLYVPKPAKQTTAA